MAKDRRTHRVKSVLLQFTVNVDWSHTCGHTTNSFVAGNDTFRGPLPSIVTHQVRSAEAGAYNLYQDLIETYVWDIYLLHTNSFARLRCQSQLYTGRGFST